MPTRHVTCGSSSTAGRAGSVARSGSTCRSTSRRSGPGRSSVSYSVGLELGGSLSGFGGPMLTGALGDQIGDLVRNIEREVGRDIPGTTA